MFTGDLARKTSEDLTVFLEEQLPEGVRLDYKRDFPNNLEKTIAAMANTEGGLILIGVDEKNRRPLRPPPGIDPRGAAERVVSKAYQAIHEPLTPEVEQIALADSDRCVVVVRIQPSERAPHAVGGGADIYRRVASQSMQGGDELDVRMDIDRISWLMRRRALNDWILDEAERRRRELLNYDLNISTAHARADIVIRPLLAHADPLSMAQLRTRAARPADMGYGESFPESALRSVSSGLVSKNEPRETYIDVTGLVASQYVFPIDDLPNVAPPVQRVIYPHVFYPKVVAMLRWTASLALETGRGGTLAASVELRGVRNSALFLGPRGGRFMLMADSYRALEQSVEARVEAPADDLGSNAVMWARELVRQVAHAFNWDADDELLSRTLD